MAVEITLLGEVTVRVDGQQVDLGPARQRCVLAALAVDAGRLVPADRLVERVWGADTPRRGRATLQSHISRLRKAFGGVLTVAHRGGGYMLAVDQADHVVDLLRFRALHDRARHTDDAWQVAPLTEALALWRGEPLTGVGGRWVDDERDRWQQERWAAEHDLTDVLLRLGHGEELVAQLSARTTLHPLDERVAGQYMLALHQAGRTADALAHYRHLRQRLVEELGADPCAALQDLHRRILDPSLTLLSVTINGRAAARSGQPLPRQLLAPPRWFLRQDPELHRPQVAARPYKAPGPALFPAPVDGFVGRSAQLEQMDSFLSATRDGGGSTPLIAVIGGVAGIGKTALALHWGHRVRARFPDGQLYVNLRGYATSSPMQPAHALGQLLRALGVPPERIPLDVDEAAGMYRSLLADRQVLILLDNACSPEQVRPLLPGGPRCLVVVTSRVRLGGLLVSDGARLLTLDILAADEAEALLTGMLGQRRVDAERQATAELAEVCGYMPLALRIAAANLVVRPHNSIARYVADLRGGNRLDSLQVDGDEQSAVRAAFDLSYAALKPDERRMFRMLGLVPGADIDLSATAALIDAEPAHARRMLGRIVDAHLVAETTSGRFMLHDLLRLYARTLADAQDGEGQITSAMDRLCAFYVTATDAAAKLLYPETTRWTTAFSPPRSPGDVPFTDPASASDWLDRERANLLALVHEAAGRGPHWAACQLADALRGYFYLRRHIGDWLAVATDALRAADDEPGPQAAAHLSLGATHNARNDGEAALTHFTVALRLAERAGWCEGQAAALNNLGVVHSQAGRHRHAAEHYVRAAAAHERAGCLAGQAVSLDNLGRVRRELGESESAVTLHKRAVELHQASGARLGHATALTNLADAYHDLRRLDDALTLYTDALTLHRQSGNRDRQAICLYGLANVHCSAGRYDEALDFARAALTLALDIADRRTEAIAANTLGSVYLQRGHPQRALEQHQHAHRLAVATSSRYVQAAVLIGMAAALWALDRTDEAKATAGRALTLIQENGYRGLQADASALVGTFTS